MDFSGAVACERPSGPPILRLRGQAGPAGPTVQLLFGGPPGSESWPEPLRTAHQLHQLRLLELAPSEPQAAVTEPRRYRIEAREGACTLAAAGVQLHRDAAAPFYGVLPGERVPVLTRIGWLLLLRVLRLPGAARLLQRSRG